MGWIERLKEHGGGGEWRTGRHRRAEAERPPRASTAGVEAQPHEAEGGERRNNTPTCLSLDTPLSLGSSARPHPRARRAGWFLQPESPFPSSRHPSKSNTRARPAPATRRRPPVRKTLHCQPADARVVHGARAVRTEVCVRADKRGGVGGGGGSTSRLRGRINGEAGRRVSRRGSRETSRVDQGEGPF